MGNTPVTDRRSPTRSSRPPRNIEERSSDDTAQREPQLQLGQIAPPLVRHDTLPSTPSMSAIVIGAKFEHPPEPILHDEKQVRVRLNPRSAHWQTIEAGRDRPDEVPTRAEFDSLLLRDLDLHRSLLFRNQNLHGPVEWSLEDEIIALVNDITDLMVSCGFSDHERIHNLRKDPKFCGAIAPLIARRPDTHPDPFPFEAIAAGCKFLQYLLKKYYSTDFKYLTIYHHRCYIFMQSSFNKQRESGKDNASIKKTLMDIKSGVMLPLIFAAAERNLWLLHLGGDQDQLAIGADLAQRLSRHSEKHGLDFSKLLGVELKMVPIFNMLNNFEADRLLREMSNTRSRRETVDLVRQRIFSDSPTPQACELLRDRLETKLTTFEMEFELEQYQEDFKELNLDLNIGGVLGGPPGGVPYQTRLHAPALFHYVLLLSRIEYFTSEEIMPLLSFIAREARAEPERYRRACRGECSEILEDLKLRGQSTDREKARAIDKWLATNPFALPPLRRPAGPRRRPPTRGVRL